MKQEYIIGDVVMYDNKVMIVKEPRDGIHFDLSCPEEGLVYCFVGVENIKPVSLTSDILEKNRWEEDTDYIESWRLDEVFTGGDIDDDECYTCFELYHEYDGWDFYQRGEILKEGIKYVHQLQHLFFGLSINHEMEV
jgi:hypothetical protein